MSLFYLIAKSWKAFVAHKKFLPLIVLIDVLFVYGLARLHYEIFSRASTTLLQLTAMLGREVQQATESEAPSLAVLQTPEFIAAYHGFLKYLGIFMMGALGIWLVGKGLAWFLAHKTHERKVDAKQFAARFLSMTLFWFAAFVALTLLVLGIIEYALFGAFPLIGQNAANALAILLYWVLAYFVFISYALVPHRVLRQAFFLGIRRWKELLPVHVVGSLVLFVALSVPASLVRAGTMLPLAFAVFVALPAVAFTRVLWETAVHQVMIRG